MKKETSLKKEVLREKTFIQQKLNSESEELSKSNLEYSRLEQRNMALAKELALLKLVSDLDLERDEILKLASLGNQANSQDTMDKLIWSLASHKKPDSLVGFSGSRTCSSSDNGATLAAATKPMFNIKTKTPSSLPLSEQGNICFSGGLLAPDGTKRHLGKWCKRGKMLGSMPTQGSTKISGDLIAVGADGRDGRIKVMRSVNQSSLDDKENSVSAKRLKYEAKTNSLQSQGCLQIDHSLERAVTD